MLNTSRTVLRRPKISDVTVMFEIENDPEVYRYLPPGRPFDLDTVTQRLHDSIDSQKANEPFGAWVAECCDTQDFIAWCVLFKLRYVDYELGFVVRKKYWNQGYGKEVAKAICDYGFVKGLKNIVATAVVNNFASCAVLEKVGFQFKEEALAEDGKSVLRVYGNQFVPVKPVNSRS